MIPTTCFSPEGGFSTKQTNENRPFGPKAGGGIIPPPPFSRASLWALTYEAREFLSEIKERLKSALLMEVVGSSRPPAFGPEGRFSFVCLVENPPSGEKQVVGIISVSGVLYQPVS